MLAASATVFASVPTIQPGSAPLSVSVGTGTVELGGKTITVQPVELTVAAPVAIEKSGIFTTPDNHEKYWDAWLPWPRENPKKQTYGAITFSERNDEHGVPMLGVPYRQYPPESIFVTSEDGATTYTAGQDYLLFENSGQIANLKNRLGQPGQGKLKVNYIEVLQRLDLVQVNAQGKVSIKQGNSRFVCPHLPKPDAGCAPLAGIYVAPWQQASAPLSADLVLPIQTIDPVAPFNPNSVAKTRAKLDAGKPVTIAYMGDSLTLGAEAGLWWKDDTQHWRGRFQHTLQNRYPDADISEIAAWQGGKGTEFALQVLNETVLPAKPDLLIIMMGINDADGPSDGSRAKVAVAQYAKHMDEIITAARDAGIEVILMTSMEPYPMKPGGHAQRWPDYVKAQKKLAAKHQVGLADTYTEWLNLEHRGMPPYSQLHNWNNHPGSFGHSVLASVPLRFFPGQ
ncbi:SGNH/GDSL hydrolase family protein [Cerasicoccus maritimus]|uniref:SGNH/GDSL hydrolase family protein n=1 Tax=Cerasicoccus maritimus TaxID=490089 RepID=UPI0028528FF5|nr:SGNH/GDSL hydrolase family protein [Cerasicoccus maritimus]